jgi:hypothetical protein
MTPEHPLLIRDRYSAAKVHIHSFHLVSCCISHYHDALPFPFFITFYLTITLSGCINPCLTSIIVYYYLCYYIINVCIITYDYHKNILMITVITGSLLPIITRSFIGSNGFIIAY